MRQVKAIRLTTRTLIIIIKCSRQIQIQARVSTKQSESQFRAAAQHSLVVRTYQKCYNESSRNFYYPNSHLYLTIMRRKIIAAMPILKIKYKTKRPPKISNSTKMSFKTLNNNQEEFVQNSHLCSSSLSNNSLHNTSSYPSRSNSSNERTNGLSN